MKTVFDSFKASSGKRLLLAFSLLFCCETKPSERFLVGVGIAATAAAAPFLLNAATNRFDRLCSFRKKHNIIVGLTLLCTPVLITAALGRTSFGNSFSTNNLCGIGVFSTLFFLALANSVTIQDNEHEFRQRTGERTRGNQEPYRSSAVAQGNNSIVQTGGGDMVAATDGARVTRDSNSTPRWACWLFSLPQNRTNVAVSGNARVQIDNVMYTSE
jgi:hypothetical protein